VSNDVLQVIVQARVRNHLDTNPDGLALTSRSAPTSQGYPWASGQDSAITVYGYHYASPGNDFVSWRTNGVRTDYGASKALLTFTNTWTDWSLVYDHPAHTLSIYTNGNATAAIVQSNVNMSGVTFRSLWLRSNGSSGLDYDNLQVSYTVVPEPALIGLLAIGGLLALRLRRS
jgi:hypothetical protein